MVTVHMHAHVRDYAAFRALFDSREDVRKQAGVTRTQVLRSQDDPNEIVILLHFHDRGAAESFVSSSDMRQAQQRAGVLRAPEVVFLDDVS